MYTHVSISAYMISNIMLRHVFEVYSRISRSRDQNVANSVAPTVPWLPKSRLEEMPKERDDAVVPETR